MLKAFKEGKKFEVECRLKKAHSNYHYVIVTGIPQAKDKRKGFIGICSDIHNEKQLEDQKTTFLSVVAHELRTPLATAQLINQLLMKKFKDIMDREDKQDLQNMYDELDSLSSLVQELLEFVRGEQHAIPLKKKMFDYSLLLSTIADHYTQTYKHNTFAVTVQNGLALYGDSKRIKQILYNLLDNAVKSSTNGVITIAAEKKKRTITTSIQDEGKGITKQEQKHIFDRFYQGEAENHRGFGLGLYIAKKIVEEHDGEITVSSVKGKGSTFSFVLPVTHV